MSRAVVLRIGLTLLGGWMPAACGPSRPFDAVAWKAEAVRNWPSRDLPKAQTHASVRAAMLPAVRARLPRGSDKALVVETLGPSEAAFPDLCREEAAADSCLFYFAGASGVDPVVLVMSFAAGQLVSARTRQL